MPKFLIDNNLSHHLATNFCEAGFNAVHVREIGMQYVTDNTIISR